MSAASLLYKNRDLLEFQKGLLLGVILILQHFLISSWSPEENSNRGNNQQQLQLVVGCLIGALLTIFP